MEAPQERETKGGKTSLVAQNAAKNVTEKSTYQQRLQLTKTVFQLIGFFRKQTPLSVKKAMDLVSEKMTSLLPDPSNIEAVAVDKKIPNPLPNMNKQTFQTIILGEGESIYCYLY